MLRESQKRLLVMIRVLAYLGIAILVAGCSTVERVVPPIGLKNVAVYSTHPTLIVGLKLQIGKR